MTSAYLQDTASYNVEWAAKVMENTINTGVLAAAVADLFYDYDVCDFFQKQLHGDTVCIIHTARSVVF